MSETYKPCPTCGGKSFAKVQAADLSPTDLRRCIECKSVYDKSWVTTALPPMTTSEDTRKALRCEPCDPRDHALKAAQLSLTEALAPFKPLDSKERAEIALEMVNAALSSPALAEGGGWRPIDSAPKNGPDFLAINKAGDIRRCWRSAPSSRTDEIRTYTQAKFAAVAWQPLPALPSPSVPLPVGPGSSAVGAGGTET